MFQLFKSFYVEQLHVHIKHLIMKRKPFQHVKESHRGFHRKYSHTARKQLHCEVTSHLCTHKSGETVSLPLWCQIV